MDTANSWLDVAPAASNRMWSGPIFTHAYTSAANSYQHLCSADCGAHTRPPDKHAASSSNVDQLVDTGS